MASTFLPFTSFILALNKSFSKSSCFAFSCSFSCSRKEMMNSALAKLSFRFLISTSFSLITYFRFLWSSWDSKSTMHMSWWMISSSCKCDPCCANVEGVAPSTIYGENTSLFPLWYVLVTLGLGASKTSICLLVEPCSIDCVDLDPDGVVFLGEMMGLLSGAIFSLSRKVSQLIFLTESCCIPQYWSGYGETNWWYEVVPWCEIFQSSWPHF